MANQQQVGPLGADVAVTHILVVTDPARSRDFWIDVLGAELYREYSGTSVVLRFAGTWLLLVSGGGPTADKPTVTFQPPADADLVSHAMTLRVTDCQAAYEALRSRGAAFLTPPYDWGSEIRCFLRDPDGHLVEISEAKASGSLPAYWCKLRDMTGAGAASSIYLALARVSVTGLSSPRK